MSIKGTINFKGILLVDSIIRIREVNTKYENLSYILTIIYDIFGNDKAKQDKEILETRKVNIVVLPEEIEKIPILKLAYDRLKIYKNDPIIEDVKFKDN